jgi:NADAR domain/Domain of unknown function (DUF4326)
MSTGNSILVEAAVRDLVWGVGLSEADARRTDPSKWPGQNLLGYLLTDLKTYFNNLTKNEKKTLDFDPSDYIRVVNVRGEPEYQSTKEEKVIIGHRGNPVLGNPFPMKVQSMSERDRVISLYKEHLDNDIAKQGPIYQLLQSIAQDIVQNKQKIALSCFCSPAPCHLNLLVPIITKMVEDIVQNNENNLNKKIKSNTP